MTTKTWIILASIFIVGTLSHNLLTPVASFIVHVPFSLTNTHVKSTSTSTIIQQKSKTLMIRNNSKDDEIAELEAKLRQLREEQEETQQQQQQEPTTAVATSTATATETYTPPSNANGDRNIDEEPLYEMLSESWKEGDLDQNGSGEGSSLVGSLVTGLVLLVGFVALSQIPVGQEGLDKYSTVKPSTSIDLGDKNPPKSILD